MLNPSIRVGLTVLLGILLIYLLITWVRRSQLFAPEENQYTILFEDVSGLLKGDPVQLRGYTVGRVEKIVPFARYVKVSVAVDADIPIFEDAKAEIQVKELMGGKQIALFPGNSSKLLQGDEVVITGNASLDFSSSFSEVGDLLSRLENQQLITTANRLDSITKWMYVMLNNIDPQAPGRIFTQTARLTDELERISLLSQKADWEGEIKRYQAKFDQTLASTERFLFKIDSMVAKVDIDRVYADIEKARSLMERAESLLGTFTEIMNSLENEEVLAGRLLHDQDLSQSLDSTLYHLNETLKQIHERKVIVGFGRKKE